MTVLTGRRARRAFLRRLRSPLALGRAAWAGGVVTVLRAVMLAPGRLRRPIARPVFSVLGSVAERGGRAASVAPFAFISAWAADRRDRAQSIAQRAGVSATTSMRSRRRLLQLAHAAGHRAVVRDILASLPDDDSPDLAAIRSFVAYADGRYTEALDRARVAEAAGVHGSRQLVELAQAYLAVLQPGWVPDLGPGVARLERARGLATRGRVLHVVAVSLPHRQVGYTIRTQSVARSQREAGLDPHVMTRAGFPGAEGVQAVRAEEVVDGIPHHRVATDFVDDGRKERLVTETARAAIAVVETVRPAVLQAATNHFQAQVALALARPFGIPVVYEVRGFWEETWLSVPNRDEAAAMETDRYRLTREVETAAMLAADAVVTLSETMRAEIIDRGCAPDRVIVVPNAVDLERFQPVPRDDRLASSLGIEPSDTVLGYVSTFSPYEGIGYLVEATARLRVAGRKVKLLLVGSGGELESIEQAGARLGLDDGTLIMPGRVPHEDVLAYYSLIDVFVVPRTMHRVSRLVTPLKPYEAMALERAVVVSDLPALREIVTPGETGLTFRAEDPDDLARVLEGLLDDPALRARLGRQAREWVATERTWTQNGRRYRELFERLGAA